MGLLNLTKEIILNATERKLQDTEGKSLNWYVYDSYGQSMGFGSTDMLSLSIKSELEALGLFDWRK